MKKIIKNCLLIVLTTLVVGCKSLPKGDLTSPDFITKYYSTSEEDCNFIIEFINQSNKTLRIAGFISEPQNLNNRYDPLIETSLIYVQPGEHFDLRLNADKLIKDFSRQYCVGFNCFEKSWCWWYKIEEGMKFKRVRIIVKNDEREGGLMLYPPFRNSERFLLREFNVEYNNQKYLGYQITEAPEEFKSFYDTRIFYSNNSNNSARLSNIFACPCFDRVQKFIENGDFSIVTTDGFKVLSLNNDPLDLNNFIINDHQEYDFIYEIVNNSSDKIVVANIITDEQSKILGLSNDIEIESGKRYQLKYNLETLKKVYGEKALIGADIKKSNDTQWVRGWINNFNHKKDKYTVIVSDGTQNRSLDIFDLWSGFPEELQKGIMIY